MSENEEHETAESFPQEEETFAALGQKIRATREAKGFSLNYVSEAVRISPKILKAIEEGKTENGPAPVFMRGFVRSYVQFLGMNDPEIVEKIKLFLKTEEKDGQNLKPRLPLREYKEPHPVRNILTLSVLLVGGYLLYSLYFVQAPETLSDNATQSELPLVEIEPEIASEPYGESEPYTESSQTPASTIQGSSVAAEALSEFTDVPLETPPEDKKSTDTPETPEPESVQDFGDFTVTVPAAEHLAPPSPLTLALEASEGTWISLSVDEKKTEDIRLQAGEIYVWEALKQYQLTIGNTQVIRVLLNGREVETDRTRHLLTDWLIDANRLP